MQYRHFTLLTPLRPLNDSQPKMPRTLWTVEQAREMGLRSAKRRAELKANPPPTQAQVIVIDGLPTTTATVDPYIEELMRAQVETLAELRACPMAKDKASLAQALKNLRETYHLATGLAKPGVLKHATKPRQSPAHESPDAPDNAT